MKHTAAIIIGLMAMVLASCDDNEPIVARYIDIYRELPIYYVRQSQNTIIDTDGMDGEQVVVINSEEELRGALEGDFLERYPAYTEVNFDYYSIVVKTTPSIGYIIDTAQSDYSIIYNPYREGWQLIETIWVDANEVATDDPYVKRIGLVVDKTDSGTRFVTTYEVREVYEEQ